MIHILPVAVTDWVVYTSHERLSCASTPGGRYCALQYRLTFPSCDSAFSIFILVAFSRRFRFPRNGDISNVSAIQ